MRRTIRDISVLTLSFALTFALLLLCCGCSSTPQVRYETVEVIKPVAIPPPPLVIPDPPEIESLNADSSDWLGYLKAMTRDILNLWAWAELVVDRVEQYNQAAEEAAPPPTN